MMITHKMDITAFIPDYLMRDSVKGKITGSHGDFTRNNGDGHGKYEYKQMEWNDTSGSAGFGYEINFSFSDKPILMPDDKSRERQVVIPDHKIHRRRHKKVRK